MKAEDVKLCRSARNTRLIKNLKNTPIKSNLSTFKWRNGHLETLISPERDRSIISSVFAVRFVPHLAVNKENRSMSFNA